MSRHWNDSGNSQAIAAVSVSLGAPPWHLNSEGGALPEPILPGYYRGRVTMQSLNLNNGAMRAASDALAIASGQMIGQHQPTRRGTVGLMSFENGMWRIGRELRELCDCMSISESDMARANIEFVPDLPFKLSQGNRLEAILPGVIAHFETFDLDVLIVHGGERVWQGEHPGIASAFESLAKRTGIAIRLIG